MRILVLGGTKFVGRALVDAALVGGHDVTLFNRGQTNPELFPAIEKLRGDRTDDLSALAGRRWDAVFDIAAYHPDVARRSVDALAESTDRYVFVSTISVYADHSRPHAEDWPLLALTADTPEEEQYGARKAACEAIVTERFGDRALIIRPGMIVGPHDPTDRLTYWPRRMARGGTVLAPGTPDDPAQFIDVRDLASWMLAATERDEHGIFNATGEITPLGDVLHACRRVTGSDADLVWVSSDVLLGLGLDPWMGIPLWIGEAGWQAANCIDISRAQAAGLSFRPLDEIIHDAWVWDRERRARGEGPVESPDVEQEATLLHSVAHR